ncbi:conserved Plasmodium protein, unknown function [Plasmodium gallinaceum]|uniref:Uncharacterized protein n=1 Tax=Plasmodium gallinaceum TaxID=5849 RepID=A0A1J1GMV4_PLAGA|nr:conserved Plasmodium protein, unknown function [Plasmodium gallinaceum]CRG93745.1 conserved Plasmodium protein, unknown function [Plasmodium gallinaceum]
MYFYFFYVVIIYNVIKYYLCYKNYKKSYKGTQLYINYAINKYKKRVKIIKYKKCKDSTFISSIQSPIIGLKINEKFQEKLMKEKKISFINFNLNNKINFKLSKGLFYKNRNELNTFLCLHYLPSISKRYLKILLENFSLNDFYIKENIVYHIILKYLVINYNKSDEKLLNLIDSNNYKFILNHARILKKNVKKKKKKDNICDNKIIDIYLKIRKKQNIIFVGLKNRKNINKVYKKIKRNINYYDIFDRLIILNHFYLHSQYRLLLLFFKNYVYKILNKNNIFIINFINKLNENNVLNKYLICPQLTHDTLYGVSLSNKKEKFKLNFLSINTSNFIENFMTDNIYLSDKCFFNNNINSKNYNINKKKKGYSKLNSNFLVYINILNAFFKKRNYYFIKEFLKQFYTYYLDNNILYDYKWYYFFITLSYSMKFFYLKKKYHVENDTYRSTNESYFINHIKIYNEDLFSNSNYFFKYPKELNEKIIFYLKYFMFNKLYREEDTYKLYSVLLFLQYVFLLDLNLSSVDFINKKSINYFKNNLLEKSEKKSNNITFENDINKICEKKKISGKEKLLMKKEKKTKNNIFINIKKNDSLNNKLSDNNRNVFLKRFLNKKKVYMKKKKLFAYIIKVYKEILRRNCFNKNNEIILIYNNTFDELYFFIDNYITDIMDKSFKNNEILLQLIINKKHILSLRKINICFLFMLVSAFDTYNCNKIALNIIKKNLNILKNMRSSVINQLLERFKNRDNEQKEKKFFLYEKIILEYNRIYTIYKQIINCCNRDNLKILINNLIDDKKNVSELKIFKKRILVLNLKQISFIFYYLNKFKLHKEIIILFEYIMKSKYFKKKFFKILKNSKKNLLKKKKESYNLSKKILFIYYKSNMCLNNFFYFSKGTKYIKNYVKYLFFYFNPLYIYYYLIKKYTKKQVYKINKKDINVSKNFIDIELKKIKNIEFFNLENIRKIKKSKILKRFFIEKIYTLINKKEYTLIFNGIMKYLYKKKTEFNYSMIDKENKKSQKKTILHLQYVYLYFHLTILCYLNVFKMSNIIFLILMKTFLLMKDINMFGNFFISNKEKVCEHFIFINSLLNNYLYNYKNNLNILENFLGVPVDICIMNKNEIIIFNLNYNEVIKTFDIFIKNKNNKTKIIFFIDYRKVSFCLINLRSFFNLHFLKNDKFLKFLNQKEIILNHENIFDISEFAIFYGNCLKKKKKIHDFFYDNYKNINIKKNKIIKDAIIVTLLKN